MGRYPSIFAEWREMTTHVRHGKTHVRHGKTRVRIVLGGRRRDPGSTRKEFRVETLVAETYGFAIDAPAVRR